MDPSLLENDFKNLTLTNQDTQGQDMSFNNVFYNNNNNKIEMEEFDAGINYSGIETEKETIDQRKQSFNSQKSFKCLEEPATTDKRQILTPKQIKKNQSLLFSDSKKKNNIKYLPNNRDNQDNIQNNPLHISKIEISYSKCMIRISQDYFQSLKNEKNLSNNSKLLSFLISTLRHIIYPSHSVSHQDLKLAIGEFRYPSSESGILFAVYNLLIISLRFPPLENFIINSILNHCIKLDSELLKKESSSSIFDLNMPKASLVNSVNFGPSSHVREFFSGNTNYNDIKSISCANNLSKSSPNKSCLSYGYLFLSSKYSFNNTESSKLESALLLISIYTKFRLQQFPSFNIFYKNPKKDPIFKLFVEHLKENKPSSDIFLQNIIINKRNENIPLKIISIKNYANFLIEYFIKKILRIEQPNLIQFFLFLCISFKTPFLNSSSSNEFMKERFFEKLIWEIFSGSSHTQTKLACLTYILGFITNSSRLSNSFLFTVLMYLCKATIFTVKKIIKQIRKYFGPSITKESFKKLSPNKKIQFLKIFSQPVFVKLIKVQSKLLLMKLKDLTTEQYCNLINLHESFLKRFKK